MTTTSSSVRVGLIPTVAASLGIARHRSASLGIVLATLGAAATWARLASGLSPVVVWMAGGF